MSKRLLAMALCMSLGGALGSARAEDLLQIYRDALTSDPTLASARASWLATQENVPQARDGLLPLVLLTAPANEQDYNQTVHTIPNQILAAIPVDGIHGFRQPAALSRAELDRI
jgi:outer membrane protein TolC